eukprot:5468490-Pyramimonas_sp.AAC.1
MCNAIQSFIVPDGEAQSNVYSGREPTRCTHPQIPLLGRQVAQDHSKIPRRQARDEGQCGSHCRSIQADLADHQQFNASCAS